MRNNQKTVLVHVDLLDFVLIFYRHLVDTIIYLRNRRDSIWC